MLHSVGVDRIFKIPPESPGENINSSIPLLLPFSFSFHLLSLPEYTVHSDKSKFLSRLGHAGHHDPNMEMPLLLKGEGEAAELRHNRSRLGTSVSSSAVSADAPTWDLLPVPAVFSIQSSTASSSARATQFSHVCSTPGQMPQLPFCPGDLPDPPVSRGTRS